MAHEMTSSMHSRRIGPHGTPESEFSIECFQNYTAPEVFVQGLAGIVNQSDVEVMIRAQKQMLQRFEKTNEMLLNCNALSANRLKIASEDFKKHTKMLGDMKKDLDYIFRKIRTIKAKLSAQYPTAFAEVEQKNSFAEEGDDDFESNLSSSITSVIQNPNASTSQSRPKSKQQQNEKKKTTDDAGSTVSYVKMDQSPSDNGKSDHEKTDLAATKRQSLQSTSSSTENNSNDSSDCTSDTG